MKDYEERKYHFRRELSDLKFLSHVSRSCRDYVQNQFDINYVSYVEIASTNIIIAKEVFYLMIL